MPHALAIDAARFANQRSNQIEVVNRMHQHFEPRHALEERPVVPRRVKIDAHFDVEDVAEDAALERVADCQHVRREAELKIHRGARAGARGKSRRSGARRQGRGLSAFESAPRRRTAAAPARPRYFPAGSRRRRPRRASTPLHRATRTRAESQMPPHARALAFGFTSKMPATGKPRRRYTGRCASRTILPAPITTIGFGADGRGHDWRRSRIEDGN